MDQTTLNTILADHKLWLDTYGVNGRRADLRGADLRGVKFKKGS